MNIILHTLICGYHEFVVLFSVAVTRFKCLLTEIEMTRAIFEHFFEQTEFPRQDYFLYFI